MKLTHSFTIPLGRAEAMTAFRDMELLADCMPGAALDEVTPDGATGRVKVKVGPIALTYRGELREVGDPASQETIHLVADARELKGLGDSRADIVLEFQSQGSGTSIKATTDVALSGRLAHFGGGVITEVADQIFGQFIANLNRRLGTQTVQSESTPHESSSGAAAASDAINPLAFLPASIRSKGPALALGALAAVVLFWSTRPRSRCCCNVHVVSCPQCRI